MKNEKSLIMAKRLKELREKKKLSHVSLAKVLKEQYGIDVSRDSLMAYEVSDPNNTKAYRNDGMKVEYLRCLAEFYGVSVDYLLGYTNDPNRNPGMVDDLGLSPEAVKLLTVFCKENAFHNCMKGLNRLLEDGSLYLLAGCMQDLSEYILKVEETDKDLGTLKKGPLAGISGNEKIEDMLMDLISQKYPGIDEVCRISIGESVVKQKKAEIMVHLEELANRVTGYSEYMKGIDERNREWEKNGF